MRPLVLAAALAATACTASIPGMGTIPPEPPQDTALTDRLLSERDLPPGFTASGTPRVDRAESDRPECEDALTTLEVTGPRPPATQARAAFTDETGWMVVHSVHRYPRPAETVLADVDAVLRECASFTLTYPDGLSMTEEVRITGADPWTADITVDSGALTVHDRLVLVPHGDRLSVLSVIGPESPDDALVDALADRAAELVSLP